MPKGRFSASDPDKSDRSGPGFYAAGGDPGPSSAGAAVEPRRRYSASSEYAVFGTWASIAFSSVRVFGLRSQT